MPVKGWFEWFVPGGVSQSRTPGRGSPAARDGRQALGHRAPGHRGFTSVSCFAINGVLSLVSEKPRLAWLDYARFVAAMSVVFFHYLYGGPRSENMTSIESFEPVSHIAEYGFLGVALFFMISGFVIIHSAAHRSAREFAIGRIVRLYPAFVVCMTLTAALSLFWGGPLMTVSGSQFLANLTMNAPMFGHSFIDGVYWTLIFELKFYVAVFIVILLGLAQHLERFFHGWIILLAASEISGIQGPLLGHYFPLFAAGGLLAFIHRHGFNTTRVAMLAVVAVLSVAQAMERGRFDGHNEIIVGLITLSFFAAFLALSSKHFADRELPYAQQLGALTYPLYLLHAHIGYMTLNHLATEDTKWLAVVLLIGAMLFVSHWIATNIEGRMRAVYFRLIHTTFDFAAGAVEAIRRA